MLDSLRAFGRTWPAKIFLGILVMSFALFGISNVIFDLGSNTVARVGEEDISAREFQRGYQAQINAFSQQTGMVPTPQDAVAMGIPTVVLNRLAADAAINRLGADFGLGVSEDRLAQLVRQDPSFGGTLGGFDRANFVRVLQANGFTEAEYFQLQRNAARRQQLSLGLFGGTPVSTTAQELVNRYTGDRRSIDYIVLNQANTMPVEEPTEEALQAYLEENQASFRAPETRNVKIISFSPQTLAENMEVSDAEIEAEYERTRQNYVRPERRTLQQVVLSTPELVSRFEAGLEAGESFEDLVAEAGVTPSQLGTLARTQVTDNNLGNAAFGLEEGAFAIIPGIGGRRAVHVSAIEGGGETPLAEVRDRVAESVALANARAGYIETLDQIEELRASFQPIETIAERFGLTLHEVGVTAAGGELSVLSDLDAESRQRIATQIFSTAEDAPLAPTISLGANNNVFFELDSVEPARDLALDEVRDQVVAAWTARETDLALQEQVQTLVADLEAGEDFFEVGMQVNQFPTLSQPLSRAGDGTQVLDGAVAEAAFGGGVGHVGSAVNGAGDYVVFRVVEITPAQSEPAPETREFVTEALRDSLYLDFVAGLRDEAGLRINQSALNQLLAADEAL
ncbi:peptidylprolyl isomerase [Arsenicitalea aurantiaca]|nr:peptidylprolyl isomerase [Arsenicitalea aurantiaca]